MRSLIPFYILIALVLLNFFFVPKKNFQYIFPTAISVGLASEVVIIFVLSNLLHWFAYVNLGTFGADGFPHFILFGWIFLIALYLCFLPRRRELWPVLIYTLFFSTMTYFLHILLEKNGIMEDYFKYFDYIEFFGNFLRFLSAYWVYQSGFFGDVHSKS